MPFAPLRFPDGVPVLTDGRVTLRPHRLDDVAAVVEQCRDPETLRWTTIPLGYDTAMGTGFVTEMVPEGWGSGAEHAFAVEVTDAHGSPRYAGTVSLRDVGAGRADIGFVAHPAVRGDGVTTSALQLLLGYGFETLGLHTVIWWADQGNWASRKVVWRCGFTFGGTVHRWLPERGEYRDGWVATLHRDDVREASTLWWDLPTLRGDRICARPFEPADDDRLVEGGNDASVQQWMPSFPSPYGLPDAAAFRATTLDAAANGAAFSWALVDSVTDDLLGAVGVPHRSDTGAEIGYWLLADERGKGYAREAVDLVVDHAFTPRDRGGLGALRAYVRIDEGNRDSLDVARACGFEMAGAERAGTVRRDGTIADMLVLERVNPLLGI
ncbi:GNAT family N-acetyltransferase [Mumia sp. zg.B53]|uniref:GNAT family N-acetyltransferase n=1 Tax=Mumia sp. zg.B53 TaxID=2855449 RepID=UPI001C6ED0F9|nr:GNAT family N-acetyltransferase [Mumia sp. zg.B53]MBW9216466.1 GNAT family N-acetyltransferase [Mumia sp. zg.B53]